MATELPTEARTSPRHEQLRPIRSSEMVLVEEVEKLIGAGVFGEVARLGLRVRPIPRSRRAGGECVSRFRYRASNTRPVL